MSVGMKRWGLRLASITALGIGLVAGSAGTFGMSQVEAASPEQYRCGEATRFERALLLCSTHTVCGEFADSVNQFQIPMAIWNGSDNCGDGEFVLPSL